MAPCPVFGVDAPTDETGGVDVTTGFTDAADPVVAGEDPGGGPSARTRVLGGSFGSSCYLLFVSCTKQM